jgi:Skp family chaperone for outer membrane proteins
VETSNVYRTAYEKFKSKVEEFRYIEPTKKAAKEDPKYEPLIEKIGEDKWDNFVETSSEAKVLIEQKDSIFNNVQSELNGKLDSYYKNNVVLSIKNYEDKLKQDVYNRVISVEEANEKLNSYQTQQINKYNLVEEDYSKKANELLQEKAALINKDIDVLYKSFQEEYNIPYQDLDELNKI